MTERAGGFSFPHKRLCLLFSSKYWIFCFYKNKEWVKRFSEDIQTSRGGLCPVWRHFFVVLTKPNVIKVAELYLEAFILASWDKWGTYNRNLLRSRLTDWQEGRAALWLMAALENTEGEGSSVLTSKMLCMKSAMLGIFPIFSNLVLSSNCRVVILGNKTRFCLFHHSVFLNWVYWGLAKCIEMVRGW